MKRAYIVIIFIVSTLLIVHSCKKNLDVAAKFEIGCGSCHLVPKIENIPKSVWEKKVLPEMAARMGHLVNNYNPIDNSMLENFYTRASGVYPEKPTISAQNWQLIHDYILSQAPDSVINTPSRSDRHSEFTQFEAHPLDFGQLRQFGGTTNIHFSSSKGKLLACNLYGNIFEYGTTQPIAPQFNSPIISIIEEDSLMYITEIGIMNPSEIPRGVLYRVSPSSVDTLYQELHRPVYTLRADLNEDGKKEILVCEYGHHTGKLSLLRKVDQNYQKETLVPLPGSIKVEVIDMNKDGKKDIVVLFAQGREGIYILYQNNNLKFTLDQVISLGPEYGSSWFE